MVIPEAIFLRAKELGESLGSGGIHIPIPESNRLLVQPLGLLIPEMAQAEMHSTQGHDAVESMYHLLVFAGSRNGLHVSTSDNNQIVSLEIRGMPLSRRCKPTTEEVKQDLPYTQSGILILVGKDLVSLKANSALRYNEAGTLIIGHVEAMPPLHRLFLIDRIIAITAQAVQRQIASALHQRG